MLLRFIALSVLVLSTGVLVPVVAGQSSNGELDARVTVLEAKTATMETLLRAISDGLCSLGLNSFCGGTLCVDACPVEGARICQEQGVLECGDTNRDGCFEWTRVEECGVRDVCANGVCEETSCGLAESECNEDLSGCCGGFTCVEDRTYELKACDELVGRKLCRGHQGCSWYDTNWFFIGYCVGTWRDYSSSYSCVAE